MSNNFYNVLTTDSLQKFKTEVIKKPNFLDLTFDELCNELNLSLVATNYVMNLELPLNLPNGVAEVLKSDVENCKLILNIFSNLTPAQATDERLWVTLCLSQFKEYANVRWPFNPNVVERSKHISNHWFASGTRQLMRDNAISRLWWMGFKAKNIPDFTIETVYEILFFNSDYRSSLIERNSSANAINVTSAILKITQEAYSMGVNFKRENFRQFMMKVDTLGGRSNLAAIKTSDLISLLKPIYQEAYEMNLH